MRRFVCESYPIDRLPRDLHPQLPTGRRVRVVIEDEISDAELLEELDRELTKGLDDLASGRVQTADEVRAFLQARSNRNLDAAE